MLRISSCPLNIVARSRLVHDVVKVLVAGRAESCNLGRLTGSRYIIAVCARIVSADAAVAVKLIEHHVCKALAGGCGSECSRPVNAVPLIYELLKLFTRTIVFLCARCVKGSDRKNSNYCQKNRHYSFYQCFHKNNSCR